MRRRPQQALRAGVPQGVRREGLHDGTPVEEDADVVGPLVVVNLLALQGVVCAVVDGPGVAVDKVDAAAPEEDLGGPLLVGGVAGGAEEAGGELEEEGVGDGGFVVESVGGRGDLPFKAPGARGGVPAGDHLAVDVLRDGEPRGGCGGEVIFCGGHGGEGPPALVVIAISQRAKEVCTRPSVCLEGGGDQRVVGGVTGVMPVVEEAPQSAARFPPVVGGGEHSCGGIEVGN